MKTLEKKKAAEIEALGVFCKDTQNTILKVVIMFLFNLPTMYILIKSKHKYLQSLKETSFPSHTKKSKDIMK